MDANSYQTVHWLENRLYLSTLSVEEIHDAVFENGTEYKGAGIRSYGAFWGLILCILGLATKFRDGDEVFYFNNKSFSKFVIRSLNLTEVSTARDAARALNEVYLKFQKTGYDEKQVNAVNSHLKKYFNQHKFFTFGQVFLELKKTALTFNLDNTK